MRQTQQIETIKKPANYSDIYKYDELQVWRNGDILPKITATKNQKAALQKGGAGRYRGKSLSPKAKRTFVSRAAYAATITPNGRPLKTFILTYRKGAQITPQQTKSHINRWLLWLKRHAGLNSFLYALELTEAGTYHYHFLVDMEYVESELLSFAWSKIRQDHSRNAVRAVGVVQDLNQCAGYAAKYFSKSKAIKPEFAEKVQGLRMWATSNNLAGYEYEVINSKVLEPDDIKRVNLIEVYKVEPLKNIEETQPANKTLVFSIYTSYMSSNDAKKYQPESEREKARPVSKVIEAWRKPKKHTYILKRLKSPLITLPKKVSCYVVGY
jgi:hypothetical protein